MPGIEVSGSAQFSSTIGTAANSQSSLLGLIVAYRRGLADFRANAPEDDDGANAYADSSYIPPMIALENWEGPATTREAAIAAIELAQEATAGGDDCLVGPLLSAALCYLRNVRY